MFSFTWTRKPDWQNMKWFDYDEYWKLYGVKIRQKLRDREKIFIDWVRPNSSVLDIACGDSPLLMELKKQKQAQVEGIDVSGLIIAEQQKSGVPASIRDISDKNFSLDKHYDYIILSEIIEHLVYPEDLLNNIKNSAKYLIISIPNTGFYRFRTDLLIKGRFFTQWAHHPAEHIRFWTHADFLAWLDALGLEVVKCQSSNGFSLGPLKFYKFWKNLFGFQICYLLKAKK